MAPRSPPRNASPFDQDESRVEERPAAAEKRTRSKLGEMEDETTASLVAPSPTKRGRKKVPRAGVGLRSAAAPESSSAEARAKKNATNAKLRAARSAQRQRVWDKLDEARQKADAKRPRLERFEPKRGRGPFEEES